MTKVQRNFPQRQRSPRDGMPALDDAVDMGDPHDGNNGVFVHILRGDRFVQFLRHHCVAFIDGRVGNLGRGGALDIPELARRTALHQLVQELGCLRPITGSQRLQNGLIRLLLQYK